MKKILLLTSLATLITSSGCIVSDDRHHRHYHEETRIEGHAEVYVPAPPTVIVRPPEIIVQ